MPSLIARKLRVELLKERREQLAVAQAGGNFPSEFRDDDERVVIAKLREMKQEQREQDEYVHSCQHYESLCKSQVRECTRDGRPEKAAIWEAAEKGIRRGEFITHPDILANPRVATQEFQSLRKLLAYNGKHTSTLQRSRDSWSRSRNQNQKANSSDSWVENGKDNIRKRSQVLDFTGVTPRFRIVTKVDIDGDPSHGPSVIRDVS